LISSLFPSLTGVALATAIPFAPRFAAKGNPSGLQGQAQGTGTNCGNEIASIPPGDFLLSREDAREDKNRERQGETNFAIPVTVDDDLRKRLEPKKCKLGT